MPLPDKAARRRRRWRRRAIILLLLVAAATMYAYSFHPQDEGVPAQRAQLAQRHRAERIAKVDATQLMADLKALSSPAMEGRGVGTPGGERARQFLVQRFRAIGLEPVSGAAYEQPFEFTPGRGPAFWRKSFWAARAPISGVNLLGRIRGTVEPDKVIVVSAHYDHLGIRNGQVYPGADDNASGVAAMLAVATWFRAHPPRHTLVFAAFDGEESGLRGAKAFVDAGPVPMASVLANVNFDMLSHNPAGEIFASGLYRNPQWRPLLDPLRATAVPTMLYGHDYPRPFWDPDDWTHGSDHGAFADKDIAWLYFGVEDHPDYHRPSDTFDRVDPKFYGSVAETMVDVVGVVDGAADAAVMHP